MNTPQKDSELSLSDRISELRRQNFENATKFGIAIGLLPASPGRQSVESKPVDSQTKADPGYKEGA